jgi:lipopolysaccharide/colanic/teichoic acid biosynthesis glycosyltransferase
MLRWFARATVAAVALVMLSPLLLAIACAIYLDDPGPVFFRQARVGRHGRVFRIWKFRSMRVVPGPLLTVGGDPRITRVGRVLRRCKLDELPQLLNVLDGTMTFVGPRPEVLRYVDLYTPAQQQVLDLMPGITDPASLAYFEEERVLAVAADPEKLYVDRILPEKIDINLHYARRASLFGDVVIVARSIYRMFGIQRLHLRRLQGG